MAWAAKFMSICSLICFIRVYVYFRSLSAAFLYATLPAVVGRRDFGAAFAVCGRGL